MIGGYQGGSNTADVRAVDMSGEGKDCSNVTDLPLRIGHGVSAKVGSK